MDGKPSNRDFTEKRTEKLRRLEWSPCDNSPHQTDASPVWYFEVTQTFVTLTFICGARRFHADTPLKDGRFCWFLLPILSLLDVKHCRFIWYGQEDFSRDGSPHHNNG